MTRRLVRIALVLATTWMSNVPAQEYRARVQGTVADSTEAVIAGATVRLKNSICLPRWKPRKCCS